jgi:hypothetical protein
VELDFGAVLVGNDVVLVIGHDGPTGDDTFTHPEWGTSVNGFTTLESFLIDIRDSRSFGYHPVFVQFDFKAGEENWDDDVAPGYDTQGAVTQILRDLLLDVFDGDSNIFDPADLNSSPYFGQWPSVNSLAGKIIPWNIGGGNYGNSGLQLNTWSKEGYSSQSERNDSIQAGYHILKMDEYQQDWTFGSISDGTAPPNPIYVKKGLPYD